MVYIILKNCLQIYLDNILKHNSHFQYLQKYHQDKPLHMTLLHSKQMCSNQLGILLHKLMYYYQQNRVEDILEYKSMLCYQRKLMDFWGMMKHIAMLSYQRKQNQGSLSHRFLIKDQRNCLLDRMGYNAYLCYQMNLDRQGID